jgi:hypothetical protein
VDKLSHRRDRPATLRFRSDGLIDYRGRNERRWTRGLTQISSLEYFALNHRARRRVAMLEFVTGKPLVRGAEVIVARNH